MNEFFKKIDNPELKAEAEAEAERNLTAGGLGGAQASPAEEEGEKEEEEADEDNTETKFFHINKHGQKIVNGRPVIAKAIDKKIFDICYDRKGNVIRTSSTDISTKVLISKLQVYYNEKSSSISNKFVYPDELALLLINISDEKWIELYCKLYLIKDDASEMLLSTLYEDYVKASEQRSNKIPVVSMASFIKHIRELNLFTIKRKSKGMMLIGYKSLLSNPNKTPKLKYIYHMEEINDYINELSDDFYALIARFFRKSVLYIKACFIVFFSTIGLYQITGYDSLDASELLQVICQFICTPDLEKSLVDYENDIHDILTGKLTKDPAFNVILKSDKYTGYFPFAILAKTKGKTQGDAQGKSSVSALEPSAFDPSEIGPAELDNDNKSTEHLSLRQTFGDISPEPIRNSKIDKETLFDMALDNYKKTQSALRTGK